MKRIVSVLMATALLIGVSFVSEQSVEVYAKKTSSGKTTKTKPSSTSKSSKIKKALKEYEVLVDEVYEDNFVDGEYYPPMGSGWRIYIYPVIEKHEEISKMEDDMTDEQKSKFQELTEKIKDVFTKR